MAKWRSNLRALVNLKEVAENRRIIIAEIHNETGLARDTIKLYLDGEMSRIEAQAVDRLCKYLDCEYGDLVELEELSAPAA